MTSLLTILILKEALIHDFQILFSKTLNSQLVNTWTNYKTECLFLPTHSPLTLSTLGRIKYVCRLRPVFNPRVSLIKWDCLFRGKPKPYNSLFGMFRPTLQQPEPPQATIIDVAVGSGEMLSGKINNNKRQQGQWPWPELCAFWNEVDGGVRFGSGSLRYQS